MTTTAKTRDRDAKEAAVPLSPIQDKRRTPAMFTSIARRYDLLNRVLSLNADRRWRSALVGAALAGRPRRVLDVATGTADVAIEFARRDGGVSITGLDPAGGMLEVAREKLRRGDFDGRVRLTEADALDLPFEDASFDAVTIAFGLRNLPDYGAGLREMARVLRPGGRLLVLEFFPPQRGLFAVGYRFYLGRVLPVAGRVVSGSPEAYRYLASSIERFVSHEEIRALLGDAGLDAIDARRLTGGVAWVYAGTRS